MPAQRHQQLSISYLTGTLWSASWMRPRISEYSRPCSVSVSASAALVYSFSADR